jgi:4-diphosphocytidyl-2-C-methyl-D-erythritol kinase
VPVKLIVRCPAKVNLFLAVGPRDERGYHPLRTIFQAIDLCDTLEVSPNHDDPGFFCDDPAVPSENTVTKALRLLRERTALPPLRVVLRKNIPAESGLGGGSSDAAGLLRAVKRMGFLGDPELETIAAKVGADVPFFLVGGRARAEGYGERLVPLPDAPVEWYVIGRPPVGCSTPTAFRRLDERPYEWLPFPSEDRLHNDFERVAPCESIDLIERLQVHGARDAGLSGSGSAVFGRFSNPETAQRACDAILKEGAAHAWIAKTLTREESLRVDAVL